MNLTKVIGATMQLSNLKKHGLNFLDKMDLFRCFGIALILFACLMPQHGDSPIRDTLLRLLGETGFLIWCSIVVISGIGLLIIPHGVVFWSLSLLPFLGASLVLAIEGVSYTAVLFYSSAYLFTLYFHFRRSFQEPEWEKRRPIHLTPLRIAGVFNFLMGLVLVAHSYGAGMALLYDKLETMSFGTIDPALIYPLIYLITGIILILFPRPRKPLAQLFTTPFIVHGFAFVSIAITYPQSWAYIPLFIYTGGIWFYLGGHGYD